MAGGHVTCVCKSCPGGWKAGYEAIPSCSVYRVYFYKSGG